MVTIFSTECSVYHDWQSVVLYESWKAAKVPGRIVRIAACSEAQRQSWSRSNNLGDRLETYLHETGDVTGGYSPLNKPWGFMSWLTEGPGAKLPNSTIVFIVDPDMSFRDHGAPGDLAVLAERVTSLPEGAALGLDYKYTVAGMRAMNYTLPRHFNASFEQASLQSIGPPIMIKKGGLHRLVQGWYDITLAIVRDKKLHNMVHDGDQLAPWIAEMYGYTLAAAGWLKHETQAMWSELEVPQPPFASTGGLALADPLLLHYSHPFELCGRRFGKNMWKGAADPLKCSTPDEVMEELHPPLYKDIQQESCKICIGGHDVIGFQSKCFGSGSKKEAYTKLISWQAWARVARGIFNWRSQHCDRQLKPPIAS